MAGWVFRYTLVVLNSANDLRAQSVVNEARGVGVWRLGPAGPTILMSPSLEDAASDETECTRSAMNYVLVNRASVSRGWSLRHNFTRETVVGCRMINPRSGVCL